MFEPVSRLLTPFASAHSPHLFLRNLLTTPHARRQTRIKGALPALLLLSALSFVSSRPVFAQAPPPITAFTYEGHLKDGGGPANGFYDFQFEIYDDSTTSTPLCACGPVEIDNVQVTDGVFTTEVDFGSGSFIPQGDRWIEIAVRPSANPADPFTTLTPRQHVTRVPYATQALFSTLAGIAVKANTANSADSATLANNVSGVVTIAHGGTGSNTKSFVDLTTNQTVVGKKTFGSGFKVSEANAAGTTLGLFSTTVGLGAAGLFEIDNAGNSEAALAAQSNGTGPALRASSLGTGLAAEFNGDVSVTGSVTSSGLIVANGGVQFGDGSTLTTASTHGVRAFTAAGNYSFTVPEGVTQIQVQMWGAGGGGSGSLALGDSGGGAGGYTQAYLDVQPGEACSIDVGSGGLGGLDANNGQSGSLSQIICASASTSAGGGGGGGINNQPGSGSDGDTAQLHQKGGDGSSGVGGGNGGTGFLSGGNGGKEAASGLGNSGDNGADGKVILTY